MIATNIWPRLFPTGALLVLLCAACGGGGVDAVTAPELASIRVSVQTSGGDLDDNGYRVVVGSEPGPPILVNQTLVIGNLSPGSHTVALADLAQNCTIEGTHPRTVNAASGSPAEVVFTVVCEATGVEIRTRTTGLDFPTSYELVLNEAPLISAGPLSVPPNGNRTVTRLPPGTYSVSLNAANNCSVEGARQRTVAVTNRTVTPVLFDVTCVPLVRTEKIAYVDGRELVVVNVDGSGPTTLTAGVQPSWSPDGTRIVFSDALCDNYYRQCFGGLVTIDPETRSTVVYRAGKTGMYPAWSPSGDMIAFSCACDDPFARNPVTSIYTMKLDGSPAIPLPLAVLSASNPAWSPDGRRMAFTCNVEPVNTDICASNADGSGLVRLTSGSAADTDPEWSPDGKRIAFTRHLDRPRVASISADGGVVTETVDGWEPSWSRDGSRLVFTRGDGLYRMDADGSNAVRLTIGHHYAPAWRPVRRP